MRAGTAQAIATLVRTTGCRQLHGRAWRGSQMKIGSGWPMVDQKAQTCGQGARWALRANVSKEGGDVGALIEVMMMLCSSWMKQLRKLQEKRTKTVSHLPLEVLHPQPVVFCRKFADASCHSIRLALQARIE